MYTVLLLIFYVFCKVNCIDARHSDRSIEDIIAMPVPRGELGDYFEGDMILTSDQIRTLNASVLAKNGLIDVNYRWPYNTVTYFIPDNEYKFVRCYDGINRIFTKYFDSTETFMYIWEKRLIKNAMQDIEANSCVRFRKRSNGEHAVRITKAEPGCFAALGYQRNQRNEQVLNLAWDCFEHGIIVHEMLHTLGFLHMQSTYNRDDYVEILWKNIQEGQEHNFVSYDRNTLTDFGVPYDYNSVMHYGSWYFSKNGQRTIIPKQQFVAIGQRIGMSQSDIEKLNRMYNCYYGDSAKIPNDTTTPTVSYT